MAPGCHRCFLPHEKLHHCEIYACGSDSLVAPAHVHICWISQYRHIYTCCKQTSVAESHQSPISGIIFMNETPTKSLNSRTQLWYTPRCPSACLFRNAASGSWHTALWLEDDIVTRHWILLVWVYHGGTEQPSTTLVMSNSPLVSVQTAHNLESTKQKIRSLRGQMAVPAETTKLCFWTIYIKAQLKNNASCIVELLQGTNQSIS